MSASCTRGLYGFLTGDEPHLRRETRAEPGKRRRHHLIDREAQLQSTVQNAPVEAFVIVERHVAVDVVDRSPDVLDRAREDARDVLTDGVRRGAAIVTDTAPRGGRADCL